MLLDASERRASSTTTSCSASSATSTSRPRGSTASRRMMRLLPWLRAHDPGFSALRRAGRAAIVMPALFALGSQVIVNPALATFAAFGSFAMLLLVEFGGPMRDRLQAQAALAAVGRASSSASARSPHARRGSPRWRWRSSGSACSSPASSARCSPAPRRRCCCRSSCPCRCPGRPRSIPDRLAGWGMAVGRRAPRRRAAVAGAGSRSAAPRRRSRPAGRWPRGCARRSPIMLQGEAGPSQAELDDAVARADAAVAALHRTFFATPYRPTGLSTSARTVVRLVDELNWLNAIIVQAPPRSPGSPVNRAACAVKTRAAAVLERGADLLDETGGRPDALDAALAELARRAATRWRATRPLDLPADEKRRIAGLVSSLDPSFRAQELSFAVSQIAANIELTAAAERRSWLERFLGRQPAGLPGTLSAAQERAAAHVARHSVWLHNSLAGRDRAGACRPRRRPVRRAALVLGRARHALRAALERAEHRPERRPRPARNGRRVRRRRRAARRDRHQHDLALVPAAAGDPVRRLRPGGDLVRRRTGRVHAHARDPVQHPPAGGLARRPRAHRGRRDRLRRQRRRSGCSSGRAAQPPRSDGRSRRPTPTARAIWPQRSSSGSPAATTARPGGPLRPARRHALPRRRGGSTTPSAATWPSAAPSRSRSPR